MKQGSFTQEIFIKADPATVIKLISDYSRHHKVHPLIVKVERATDAPAGVDRYWITDRLQWGPFKFKIKYRADIIAVTADSVHTEAYQAPGTYVTNITTVIPNGDGVRLHESIIIKAPDPLFGYTFKQAEAAHAEMLKRIKIFVENEAEK